MGLLLPDITLEVLLDRCGRAFDPTWNVALEAADSHREREGKLRQLLPGQVLRRFDAAFARSATVHPDSSRALYAVCRALAPQVVFETGTYWGYSTAYLAAALEDSGGSGKIWTFDLYEKAGKYIPKDLLHRVERVRGRAAVESMPEVLRSHTPTLFFQDSVHDYEGVAAELTLVAPFMGSGSVILLHDFVTDDVRRAAIDVLEGWEVFVLRNQDPQCLGVAVRP